MYFRLIIALFLTGQAYAETIVPTRTIRANTIISETDVTLAQGVNDLGYSRVYDVIGQEARTVLYSGRPILFDDIGPPAIVTRNQLVRVLYFGNGVSITTEGRALERGAVGDRVRFMNLSSRAALFGQVQEDGSVQVTR
jgi:flagella basal body P-ring formation protein FlgA